MQENVQKNQKLLLRMWAPKFWGLFQPNNTNTPKYGPEYELGSLQAVWQTGNLMFDSR